MNGKLKVDERIILIFFTFEIKFPEFAQLKAKFPLDRKILFVVQILSLKAVQPRLPDVSIFPVLRKPQCSEESQSQ